MALRLGKFVGNGPAIWLRMQQAHDLWNAEQRMTEQLSKIKPAAKNTPDHGSQYTHSP
jgi:plasmid maintenance system antidote protein VapI